MRHKSVRVNQKNYRTLGDKPLFFWILRTLQKCQTIDNIVIDTDSDLIINLTRESFQDITIYKRPPHLRDGSLSMNLVLKNTLAHIDGDYFLQTHSTNPFLQPDTIDRAVAKFFTTDCDSLFSVTKIQSRLWSQDLKPVNHNPKQLLPTQELPPIYEENSNFYIFTRQSLSASSNRIGNNPCVFEVDKTESVDIDTNDDFDYANMIARTSLMKMERENNELS